MDVSTISPSKIRLLQLCGEAFRRKYIEGERTWYGTAAAIGIATHKSAENDLTCKIDMGARLPDEAIADYAADSFELIWDTEEIELTKEEKEDKFGVHDKSKDQVIRLAELHHKDLAPIINPREVERRLELEVEGFPLTLVGYADVIEDNDTIRDLKTRGKTPKATDAQDDIGLQFYSVIQDANGERPQELALDVLFKTKTPKLVTVTSPVQRDHDATLGRIERAAHIIQSGAYMPAEPTHWKCSEKFCEFFDACRWGKRRQKQFESA